METQQNNFEEAGAGSSGDATILELLNPDCWRLVLDHLTINDIVRSERVSRGWQQVVLDYLQGVHNYQIEYSYAFYSKLPDMYDDYRRIELQGHVMLFEEMVQKMGPFFVKIVANCIDEERLKAIAVHCPNLEAITLYRTFRGLALDQVKKCKQLKRVVFEKCALREDYLNDLIASESLEELVINKSTHVNGRFLKNLKTNMKTLALNECEFLQISNVQSALQHLTELTRLELSGNPIEILKSVHLLLNEMPDLEHLSLMEYSTLDDGEVLPSIGCLSRLRELHLWENGSVTDEWLVDAARSCPALRTVNVGDCHRVSPRGVVALCRARPTLVELVVTRLDVTNEDLEACARCCTDLALLDAIGCFKLKQDLPARLAWPRASPLRLRLFGAPLNKGQMQVPYKGLTIDWGELHAYNPYNSRYSDSEPDYDNDYDDYELGLNSDSEERDWDDEVEEYLDGRDADY